MKKTYNHLNKKIYYIVVLVVMAIMIMGLFINNPRLGEWDIGYITHSLMVLLLSICLQDIGDGSPGLFAKEE